MIPVVVLFLCFCWSSASGMTIRSSKIFSFATPDGSNKMGLSRLTRADSEASASGFLYNSDGLGPATVQYLNSPEVAQTFQRIMHDYERVKAQPHDLLMDEKSFGRSGYFADSGQKGDSGYDVFDGFHRGIQKNYNNNGESGFEKASAGHKKAHQDIGGYHGGFNTAAKGEKGGQVMQVSSNKKGHKTTGFHKVYHKDEYKKEHTFYDESDSSGSAKKYGNGQSSFELEKGSFQKGSNLDSGYQAGEKGEKGYFDKGKYEEDEEGSHGAKGGRSQFSEQSEFGNKGSDEFRKRFGKGENGFRGY